MRPIRALAAVSAVLTVFPVAALAQATEREPLDVARVLAARYPESPSMSYIPGLAWSGAYGLYDRTGEQRWLERPRAQMRPFLTGAQPAIAQPYSLTSLGGHMAFADAAVHDRNPEAFELARRAADFILPASPDAVIQHGRGWTDDMFMASSVLARVAERTGDERYAAALTAMLAAYARRLQRPDGLFIHAEEGAHAWGRGNGFAALGMAEALTRVPGDRPERAAVLDAFRRQMEALLRHQTEEGSWREVVDQPDAYPELTVTALAITAMARGMRYGLLDADTYLPAVERGWRAVLARVGEDGTLRDVCTSTGAQATLEYYMTRPVVNGADDRGGAIALYAALEMYDLRRYGFRLR